VWLATAEGLVAAGSLTSGTWLSLRYVRSRLGKVDWRSQDTRFAVATVLASLVNLYLIVGNVGLVPPVLAASARADELPSVAIATPFETATAAPRVPTSLGVALPPSAAPVSDSTAPPTSAPDTTPPLVAFMTASGSVVTSTVDGTASDTKSGIEEVVVTYADTMGGTTHVVAVVHCSDTTRRSCTWSATVPTTLRVSYTAVATATDRSGNKANGVS